MRYGVDVFCTTFAGRGWCRKRHCRADAGAAENGAAAQTQAEAQNATAVQAEQPGLWQRFTHNVAETWNNSPNKDIYLPAITWHNRWTYDDEHIDKYNERPWGAGYGISRFDQDGDWHGIYLMAFKDSFNKWEPIGGYAYEKIWAPLDDKDFPPWPGLYSQRHRA
ncbi:Lipid A palmitoyltransferase PagP precursor [Serratia odorifera]|uniref:Lipid A palmitoyltransferase PagP n=1 Tax=Serratia odorifera TaxID=618 RepID=A0A3S4DT79_SEROD|nr:Lipid A palmitoyltransferase PagP precursor [Serratia odorifera]